MFVSGPWPVRVGRAGQEADGGEVGGGGGGVGSGAASEVAVWACGVAAAARAAATAPGLRLFILGALGGVAGVWEGRESGVCMRFSSELEGERMRTSGLLGAGGGGAAGAGAGGWGEPGAGAAPVCSRIHKRSTPPARAASAAAWPSCRRAAAGEVPPAHAWRASPRVQRCGGCVRSQHACSPAPSAMHAWI